MNPSLIHRQQPRKSMVNFLTNLTRHLDVNLCNMHAYAWDRRTNGTCVHMEAPNVGLWSRY